ncbi:helix-turn-helix transcriptional regulator [Streptomyces sp. NPDC047525]|uniref:helix-turn-helix domain-containing protein n=1 Tax=Streptomyces sp. NPDC047525 TaxID=3155264 RepID=UPI0033D13AC3
MGEPRASAPVVLRIVLGGRLRALRESAKVTREQAAKIIDVTPLTIRRLENAEVRLKIPYVDLLLRAYNVDGGSVDEFLDLAKQANEPGWWNRYRDVLPDWFSAYVSLEDAASLIRAYEPHYAPGLLQTKEYARTILSAGLTKGSADELERRVDLRLKRQELLTTSEAPALWVVLEEAVLQRPVGGTAVMRGQLERLLESLDMPNISLQILPFSIGPHLGAYGPFSLFRFESGELGDVVYTEGLTDASYQDEPLDVAAHLEALDHMSTQASTVDETRKILEKALKEHI